MKNISSLLVLLSIFAYGEAVVKEPFDKTPAALKQAGWKFNDKLVQMSDGCIEVSATGGERHFMLLDVPVTPGKSYCGSIKIKSLGVVSRNNMDRGATLFFGFLAEDKSWINGGEFPRGVYETCDWRTVEIPMTVPVPANARYIQVWVGVEGQGKACFKDFSMEPFTVATNWRPLPGTNPPCFEFETPKFGNTRVKNRLCIQLSKNPKFPESETYLEIVSKGSPFEWPYALVPGHWYARAFWIGRTRYEPVEAELEVSALTKDFACRITPEFPNGVFTARPQLKLRFYPQVPEKIDVFLGDDRLEATPGQPNELVCTVKKDLKPGNYDVTIKANGRESRLLYVNRNPAHRFTYRDDMMLMLDGKPFFPVGTYRDPSDKLDVFDGIEKAGFNVAHNYHFEAGRRTEEQMKAYLDDCQKHNLMVFMGIPRNLLMEEKTAEVARYCAEIYDHPALLTYYQADEPELWINPYSMKLGTDTVKQHCPGVPRTILLCTADGGRRDAVAFYANGLSEILWHDPYPIPRSPITTVKTAMESMRRMSDKPQSMWCVVQAFDWDQSGVLKKAQEDINPKAGQIRCMAHLALAADVQGIIFYWLPQDRYHMVKNSPIQWAEVCSTTKELNSLMPFLIGRNAPQTLELPQGVDYWCRRSEDGRHALGIINTTDKPVSFSLKAFNQEQPFRLKPWGVEVRIFQ